MREVPESLRGNHEVPNPDIEKSEMMEDISHHSFDMSAMNNK
jgi:hypothetical protein